MSEKLIFVSADSHATPPLGTIWREGEPASPALLEQYVEKKYHHLLHEVYEDNEKYMELSRIFGIFPQEVLDVIDPDGVWASGGYLGCWDVDIRLREMDREGVAAEIVYAGDPRAIIPFSSMYRVYDSEISAAGVRAYNRWIADAFGKAKDRIMYYGDAGAMPDIDAMVAELTWMKEHGFSGVMLPMLAARGMPPLHDEYFEPFWSACEEYGLPIACHAGYGNEPGEFFGKIETLKENMIKEGRSDLLSEIINNQDGFFQLDLRPRQAMWQMMIGGVFDRHPDLRLIMTEVRGDWVPATFKHLDAVFDRHRDELTVKQRPSEYWRSNCVTSLSFIHKAEVGMRHDIGLETIMIGRDYPHTEGTWPNSRDWLSDVFQGTPDADVKLMLGETAVRALGLDRAHLQSIADRIGLTIADITGRKLDLDPRMIESWDARGGYLKPVEQIDTVAIDELLERDIALTSTSG